MKRLCLILAILLCVVLLGACQALALLEQIQREDENISTESSAPSQPDNSALTESWAPVEPTTSNPPRLPAESSIPPDPEPTTSAEPDIWWTPLRGKWTLSAQYGPLLTLRIVEDWYEAERYIYPDEYRYGDDYDTQRISGKIVPQWMNPDMDADPPDLICFEPDDFTAMGGDFIWELWREDSVYMLTLVQANNGDSMFAGLDCMYESIGGPFYLTKPIYEGLVFDVYYWGMDDDGLIYLDTIGADGNADGATQPYPVTDEMRAMLEASAPGGHAIYQADVDENGVITRFWMEESTASEYDFQNELVHIIRQTKEGAALLDAGMDVLYEGLGVTPVPGAMCREVSLGTGHGDQFVREAHFAVDWKNRVVYLFDVLENSWEVVS